jgi:DNA-3-methyladenine glycosylase II
MKRTIRETGVTHLRTVDPVMRDWIERAGPCLLQRRQDRFGALVRAILAQQISAHVANVIRKRIIALCAPGGITPVALLRIGEQGLRSAGCSRQKIAYLLDLSDKVQSGALPLHHLGRFSDEVIIERMIAVKGIGVWTAQMFLIFSLGRPNVFPYDDLAVRTALQKIYRMKKLPDKKRMKKIADRWQPYASVGSWYCWRWHYIEGAYKPKP